MEWTTECINLQSFDENLQFPNFIEKANFVKDLKVVHFYSKILSFLANN